ncbi:MAG: HEAT repeat domain-containing protein [Planctomycetota bacterium]|jgi:hypothetical protein
MTRQTPALAIAAFGIVATGVFTLRATDDLNAQQRATNDATYAVQALDAVRGLAPLACDMVVRSLTVGWWGEHNRQPDTNSEHLELQRWMAGPSSDPAAVAPLVNSLNDTDPCVRRVGARLLGNNRHPSATEALLRALSSSVAPTRAAAAIGLGVAQQRNTVSRLIAALGEDAAPSVRAAAAWALGEIDDPRATPILIEVLEHDSDPAVRQAAAWALGEMQ